ncbi:MAG: sigma-54-dependent Fis family transcriptional regulator [Nitrospirae bacterium]|nr:sigma-54-dependent Fis family transcriptional regulator [Nitrospirota bacterium]
MGKTKTAKDKILVVDDEQDTRDLLTEILKNGGYAVSAMSDGPSAIEEARKNPFNLAFVDLKMPGMDGIEVIKQMHKIDPDLMIILLTGYGTIDSAVRAMKAGAYDYITKPFQVDEILMTAGRALEHQRLQTENTILKKTLANRYKFENIIGASKSMDKMYEIIERVADSDSTVLIQGESGTGKELVARTIHFNSPRKDGPFIPINCGAIPEGLLESELFGHEKGAFTGAVATRLGRFELANSGTIFLDEVGEMPPALQVKLLRVLQSREFERVGGTKTIKVDIRILAATNQDLEEALKSGKFREDLYYRLNVVQIHIPPLRERKDDVPLLLDHFVAFFNERKKKNIQGFSSDAMKLLMDYRWPGNVREIENLIERLAILKGSGIIEIQDLPEKISTVCPITASGPISRFPDEGVDLTMEINEFENRLILSAMEKANGVKSRAAHLLRLNRTTLVEKMKKKGLTDPAGRKRACLEPAEGSNF